MGTTSVLDNCVRYKTVSRTPIRHEARIFSPLSSPAQAGDPVFQRRQRWIEGPRRTGYPAFAGYDESLCRTTPCLPHAVPAAANDRAPRPSGPASSISHIGFDRPAARACAVTSPTFSTFAKMVLQKRTAARPGVVDIQQFSGELLCIGLGHVDPADALRLLRDAGTLRQIEREPARGAVVRRQHASCAGAHAHGFDLARGLAPADADAAHGGVATIARQPAGVGLHDQKREQQDARRRRPAQAEIGKPLLLDVPSRRDGRRQRRQSTNAG